MTTHDDAREWVSARRDGELPVELVPELDAHLAGCATCRAYAHAVDDLGALVTTLPVDAPSPALPARVRARIGRPRWRRGLLVVVPAFALAVVLFVLTVTGGTPLGVFPLPDAAAAESLRGLHTLYAERELVETTGAGTVVGRTIEKVWYRAPGYVRIERDVQLDQRGGPRRELVIERPGLYYSTDTGLITHRAPTSLLPEPISPTLALLGTPAGAGPAVAGRPTVRLVLTLAGQRREALVDADSRLLLGTEQEVVVLSKQSTDPLGQGKLTKTTRVIRFNEPVDESLLEVPDNTPPGDDEGFRRRPVADLVGRPGAVPRGFILALAGQGRDGESLLYAQGALEILVELRSAAARPSEETRLVMVAGRTAVLGLSLYRPPQVHFAYRGQILTISAPLPPDSLVRLAAQMFPE